MEPVIFSLIGIVGLGFAVRCSFRPHKAKTTQHAALNRAVRWYQELENADIYTKAEQLPKWRSFVMSLPGQGDMIKRIK